LTYTLKTRANKNNFFRRIIIKIGKLLARDFPFYKARIFGLKLCGFEVGNDVYIGENLIVVSFISDNNCKLIINDRVSIAPRVTFVLASDANWSELMETREIIEGTIVLENDCWIGAGAIVLPNITIGERAIVGAGAVVTKDVKAGDTVVGVPARSIKNESF
jgi:acetyltransferase-like isoleucine patch superfamily enzyme